MVVKNADAQAPEFEGQVTGDEYDRVMSTNISTVFDITTLRDLDTFDAALALAEQEFGDISDANEVIGSKFLRLKDKRVLVDTPFLVLYVSFPASSRFNNPETGEPARFANAHVITEDGRRFIIVDGSTGLYPQLEEWALRSGRNGGLLVKGGLRESTYPLPDGSGEGVTYYLNV